MIGFANLLVCIETLCYMEFYNKKQDETGQRTFQDESFIQNSFFFCQKRKRANCLRVRIEHKIAVSLKLCTVLRAGFLAIQIDPLRCWNFVTSFYFRSWWNSIGCKPVFYIKYEPAWVQDHRKISRWRLKADVLAQRSVF